MHRPRHLTLWLISAVLACLVLSGCGPKGLDNFRKVQAGWTLEQVRELLGEPDQVKEAGGLAAVWTYENDGIFGDGSTLTVNSLGGKVMLTTITKNSG